MNSITLELTEVNKTKDKRMYIDMGIYVSMGAYMNNYKTRAEKLSNSKAT